jgi:hypothetical protein
MPEVEVFIGVTIKNDDGSTDKHSLSGKVKDMAEPTQAVAVVGMKVLKQILAEMRSKS